MCCHRCLEPYTHEMRVRTTSAAGSHVADGNRALGTTSALLLGGATQCESGFHMQSYVHGGRSHHRPESRVVLLQCR